ncbi:MAG: RnfABCDGE type electron transport complex subunit D [Clostridia bacterium]|nr:RnfABCDGE type electron transport complex subunit D [Clostridia bacterium]
MRQNNYAPFIHTEKTAPYMYVNVIVALLPCICLSVANYGIRALFLILISQLMFFTLDVIFSRMFFNTSKTSDYYDFSSLISGIIFALMLPPDTSIFVVLLGVLFGSLVVKQLFGGVGSNIVNPSIAARLFVQLVVPDALSGFSEPFENAFKLSSLVDISKTTGAFADTSSISLTEIAFGNFEGYLGIGCGFLVLFGFGFMLFKRLIRGYAFIGYMFAILVFYPALHIADFFSLDGFRAFVVFVISSGVLFIAAFALGDFTTMPMNPLMRFFSGLICATFTVLMYGKVDLMIALCAPVIIVNFMTPSLDYFASTLSHKEIITKERGDSL